MASESLFRCGHCGFEVAAWTAGHPFLTDDHGNRHFFYHPGEHDVAEWAVKNCAWARGRDPYDVRSEVYEHSQALTDALCNACATLCSRVPRDASARCTSCGSADVTPLFQLPGEVCPKCRAGTFGEGTWSGKIS